MCTSPKDAWQHREDGGKLKFYRPKKYWHYEFKPVPCKKCIACEKLRALKQAVQMACEIHTTEKPSWFFTNTYNDEHIPDDYSISLEHTQKFHRDVRYKYPDSPYRYVCRHEYGGSETSRPHYHIAVFGLEIEDLELYSIQKNGNLEYNIYESETINKIWGKGSVKIIDLVVQNCLYIAQHHLDEKIDEYQKRHELEIIHPVTGEIINERKREFTSRSLGIGKEYFGIYIEDIFPDDFIVTALGKTSVPDYFLRLLERTIPDLYTKIKDKRKSQIVRKTLEQNIYQDKYNRVLLAQRGKTLKNMLTRMDSRK